MFFFEPASPRIESIVLNAEQQRQIAEYMRDSFLSPVGYIVNVPHNNRELCKRGGITCFPIPKVMIVITSIGRVNKNTWNV